MRNYISDTYTHNGMGVFQDKIDRSCSAAYVIVCCGNDVAGMALHDAVTELRGYPHIYRMEVKRAAKTAEERFQKYERLLRETLKERFRLWMDIADGVNEEMHQHVFNLYMSFKQHLDTNGIPLSALRARIYTADTLLNISVRNFDDFFKVTRESTGADLSHLFQPARLDGIQRAWNVVCNAMSGTDAAGNIDFNESPRCRLAVDIICRRIADHEMLNRAGLDALRLNPELTKDLSEEDRKFLNEA